MTEQEVAKYELLMQVMGQRGLSWEGDEFSQRRARHRPPLAAGQDLHHCRRVVGDSVEHHCQARPWPADMRKTG